jgi:hypothetical protein
MAVLFICMISNRAALGFGFAMPIVKRSRCHQQLDCQHHQHASSFARRSRGGGLSNRSSFASAVIKSRHATFGLLCNALHQETPPTEQKWCFKSTAKTLGTNRAPDFRLNIHNKGLRAATSLSTCKPTTTTRLFMAKPKRGDVVDSYQTVSVNCNKCRTRLFRYKKKNGTKSNLVKCYIERISEDCAGVLQQHSHKASSEEGNNAQDHQIWTCPSCETQFARSAFIHGRPALKLVGGKVRMTKK